MREPEGPGDQGAEAPLNRTISPIAGRLGSGRGGRVVAFAGLLAGCGVLAFATWSADRPRPEAPPEQPARQVVPFEPALSPPTLAAPGPGAPTLGGDDVVVPAIASSGDVSGQGAAPAPGPTPQAARLMAWSRSSTTAQPLSGAIAVSERLPGAPAALTDLDQLRQGSAIGQARARPLADRNFMILAGATIPCVLQTALDSSTPGYVTCIVPQAVWSDNGAVVLLDKGTRVLGEYRAGLRQGQRRLFVLWTRAVTPAGIAIDLASPAADALGRAGFDGDVDTRFWDRFGGAFLLSIVDDGAYAVAGADSRSATARLPSDAASIALQSTVGLGPVLRRAQGSEVTILAARDFDFSSVYRLRNNAP